MRRLHRPYPARAAVRNAALSWVALACLALLGCEDAPRKADSVASKDTAASNPEPVATPKIETAPDLEIDTVSTKVGFERALLQNPEGRAKLAQLLGDAKKWIEGKDVKVVIDRKVKVPWVATYLDELGKLNPSKITIRTETRKDFAEEQRFTPEAKAKGKAPACSLVGMVTSDFGTAVWKLSGGVASKRGRGMAGPDLSMTGETIERIGKTCAESSTFFVAVAEGVDWGLAFDLAASSRVLEKVKFEDSVLLGAIPTPGHKVTLKD
jgi:hypothetical protein